MEEMWSFDKKKNYVLEQLYDEAGQIGRNQVWLVPRTVTGGESEYDTTFLYRKEYSHILEVLEFENLLRVLDRNKEKGFHIELLERANKQTSWYVQDGYKTIRDVLLNAELRESLLGIILRAYGISDAREFNRKRSTKTDVDERRDGLYQDEKILLLEALSIAKADWDGMKKQTHRPFGNRLIEVYFNGEKAGDFVDALLGKKSLIEKRVLKLIAESLSKLKPDATGYFWSDFFIEQGIPSSLFPTNSPDLPLPLFIYEVLVILSSTENEHDKQLLEKVLSETVHPLFYDGDEGAAKKQEQELNKLLKFSGLILHESHLIPTTNEPPQQSSSSSKPIIKAKAIEQLSRLIKDMMTESQIRDLFSDAGVSDSIIPTEAGSKQKLVYGVLNTLSTTVGKESKALLFHLLEEACHPLYLGNDTTRAKEVQINITKMIRYDELSVIGGSIHQFNEKDEAIITEFEEERKKFDPAFAEGFAGLFGGAFSSPRQQAPIKKEEAVSKTEIHIHNNVGNGSATYQNSNTQTPSGASKTQIDELTRTLEDAEKDEAPEASSNSQVTKPLRLPNGTKWEDITIKFIDGENAKIFAKELEQEVSFKEMGFQNNKTVPRKPNKQWLFLKTLAGLDGFISWDSGPAHPTLKKTKQLVSEGLKAYFGFSTDPFADYKAEKGYRIKIKLIPIGDSSVPSTTDDFGIEEELSKYNG